MKLLGATEDEVLSVGVRLFTRVDFEASGVDVVIHWRYASIDSQPNIYGGVADFKIELKPTMGDDYPAVIRQMKRLQATFLILGQYTGRGVSERQLREMFEASGLGVVFVQEIEEYMRRHPEPMTHRPNGSAA